MNTTPNITLSIFLFVHLQTCFRKLRLLLEAMKSFSRKLLGVENRSCIIPESQNSLEKFKNYSSNPPIYLIYDPLVAGNTVNTLLRRKENS